MSNVWTIVMAGGVTTRLGDVEDGSSYMNYLPEEQARTFREHMDECPPCINYLESYRETVRLGREVCRGADDAIPDDVPEQLVQAVLAARRNQPA